jgi:hypothetical protein
MKRKKKSKKAQFDKKIREYRRFLKGDEDWDWAYVVRLLQYKLERTRKCIVSNNFIVGAKRVGCQIEEVERLLGRVLADRYYDEISKDFRKRYGSLRMKAGKSDLRNESVPVEFVFARETPRNRKQVHREFSRLQRRAAAMQQADMKRAFTLMSKNIWNWWN